MMTRFGFGNVFTAALLLAAVTCLAEDKLPGFARIPAGQFEMGDHHGFVDPKHGGDETPIHTVRLDAFYLGRYTVTTREYCAFLNSAWNAKQIEVREGGVFLTGGADLLCESRTMSPYSRIGWDGKIFSVLDGKENHPVVCIRWPGAAAYCNWLSAKHGKPLCYNPANWDCDFNRSGFRLPTEAEWEYAARGGLHQPYRNFPCGDEADPTRANWPESKNPFRVGPLPWTTPVGFFNGQTHKKSDFGWPDSEETFRTSDGANGYGLYDMTGNVWQFINDWYGRDYYAYSPTNNPPGPAAGSLMPDGKPYRGMRGGNWYNGENGHGRVSNRNPSYFRGPQDPNHPYYHLGFRVALPENAEQRPVIRPTPVQQVRGGQGGPAGGSRPRPENDRRGGPGGERPNRPPPAAAPADAPRSNAGAALLKPLTSFVLTSPAVVNGGELPVEFTGDGASATLPLDWQGAPEGTRGYALIMHHEAPDQTKWYWILYHLPSDTHHLPKNVKGVGTLGNNSVNRRQEYAPPHSKGPGAKTYTYTLYALSSPPQITVPPAEVNRDVLLAAMKDCVLATAQLSVTYTRPEGATSDGDGSRPGPARDPNRQPGRGRPPGDQ